MRSWRVCRSFRRRRWWWRGWAQAETYDRLAHELTPQRCADLDGLLLTDTSIGMSRLRWLSTGPVEASAAAVKNEVEKLGFLRALGADTLDMSVLPAERRRFLATLGRRLTGQALERRDPQRRYPILLTLVAQSGTDKLDEVVALFDQALSAKFSAAEKRMQQELADRGKAGEDRQALLDDLLSIVYLDEARKSDNAVAYRHYWELCVLLGLRDVFVPGSRRYADPAAYLLTPQQWEPQRAEFCRLVGKSADPARALAALTDEWHDAVGQLETVLAAGDGPVRLDEDGALVISLLSAEDIPSEATALKAELTQMLPFAPIVSLLIELDKRTGYLDCFTHASGKQARSAELKRNLIAVLVTYSTNLGLTSMAEASGISYDMLAWTAEWYVREETLRAANLALIGYHQRLPLTASFGTGTLSSSDGQRFPTRGKSTTARTVPHFFAEQGLSTYTHVIDQHTTYRTKIIVTTRREPHYAVLSGWVRI